MMPTLINCELKTYKIRHDRILRDMLTDVHIPAPLIRSGIEYALFPGGKRLRPLLIYACGEALDIPLAISDVLATAVEMVHVYSLIHDDLPAMDNDDLRRGRPTCHRAFDEATAILVGDALQALAVEVLIRYLSPQLPAHQVMGVTRALIEACGPSGMVSGQSLDLSLLQESNPISEAQLETIHHLKTGQLILACINMPIATGHFSPGDIQGLQKFAYHLGLLFQIQDDYLDQHSRSHILNKGRSSDIANHKQTFSTLYSPSNLIELIHQHTQQAQQAIACFADRSQCLQDVLHMVYQRTLD